jgi:hypothetical protein
MHEIAGDYACYFDPYDTDAIAAGMARALEKGTQHALKLRQFSESNVRESFLVAMDECIAELKL